MDELKKYLGELKNSDKLKKYLPKISFGTVIIAFFLPFVLVECDGERIANLNGIQLVTGTEIGIGSGFGEEDEKIEPNLFATISLLSAIIGLFVVFRKIKNWEKIALIISITGLVGLLLLYNNVNAKALKSGEGMISISLGIGFYLAFIAYLAISVFLGANATKKEEGNVA